MEYAAREAEKFSHKIFTLRRVKLKVKASLFPVAAFLNRSPVFALRGKARRILL
jgi:hypothetical protein